MKKFTNITFLITKLLTIIALLKGNAFAEVSREDYLNKLGLARKKAEGYNPSRLLKLEEITIKYRIGNVIKSRESADFLPWARLPEGFGEGGSHS